GPANRCLSLVICVMGLWFAGCWRGSTQRILDCSAEGTRHILRIHTDRHTVDDMAFTPPRTGTAAVTDAFYILRFETGSGSSFMFRINRGTIEGSRALIGEDGKMIEGHGGFERIVCKSVGRDIRP